MAFGKVGRPPEDRLGRQREIYLMVAPLILKHGARRFSMREAADAAYLSTGGLYHYFPTKEALLLHALSPAATARCCQDFHSRYGHLAAADPAAYLERYMDFAVEQISFFRPSVQAAIELGADAFWNAVNTSFAAGVEDFGAAIHNLAPTLTATERALLGQALRKMFVAAVLDRQQGAAELREELRSLIQHYTSAHLPAVATRA
jgi:AcrR family transcriptional regulator